MDIASTAFQYLAAPTVAGVVVALLTSASATKREKTLRNLEKKHEAYDRLLTLLHNLFVQMNKHADNGYIFSQTEEVRKSFEQIGELDVYRAEVLTKIYSSRQVSKKLNEWVDARNHFWLELAKYNDPVSMTLHNLSTEAETQLSRAKKAFTAVGDRQEDLLLAIRKDLGLEPNKFVKLLKRQND